MEIIPSKANERETQEAKRFLLSLSASLLAETSLKHGRAVLQKCFPQYVAGVFPEKKKQEAGIFAFVECQRPIK